MLPSDASEPRAGDLQPSVSLHPAFAQAIDAHMTRMDGQIGHVAEAVAALAGQSADGFMGIVTITRALLDVQSTHLQTIANLQSRISVLEAASVGFLGQSPKG